MRHLTILLFTLLLTSCLTNSNDAERRWLAGDHHIHSQFSVGWARTNPPEAIIGGDAIYPVSYSHLTLPTKA